MSKSSWIVITLLLSPNAYAFNPFKVVTASAAKQFSKIFSDGGIDDVLDTGDSLIDLLEDAKIDEGLIQELDKNVKRLEDLNQDVKQLQAIEKDFKDFLSFDLSRSKSIAGKLKFASRKIRHGKRLYSLLSGSKSGLNSGPLQVEQLRINYRMLDELRNLRLNEFNQYLEQREHKVRLQAALEKALTEEQQYQKSRWKSLKSKRGSL